MNAVPRLFPRGSQANATADDDGLVPTGHIQFVHGLAVQLRRPVDRLCGLPAQPDHVRRDIAAIDVQPGRHPRNEQPASATRDVQGRLASLDELPEVVDLRSRLAEQRPPPGHQSVMPTPRLNRTHLEITSPPRAPQRSDPASPWPRRPNSAFDPNLAQSDDLAQPGAVLPRSPKRCSSSGSTANQSRAPN